MSSVYGRLGFPSSDPIANSSISDYSTGVTNQMELMPKFLNEWQTKDMVESNVGDYFQNPTAISAYGTWGLANTVLGWPGATGDSSDVTQSLTNTYMAAAHISANSANTFIYTTNRLSNVVDPGDDTVTPHFELAMGVGKLMAYLTYQTDGVSNNSPMLGSFSSILATNTLNSLYSTLVNSVALYANTITVHMTGLPPNVIYTYTSNIGLDNAKTLENAMVSLDNLMTVHPLQDTIFYNNSRAVLDDFTTLRQFNDMGYTETELLTKHIGSPKLLSRITT
jgi:hypothetical protein